ncbi:MAG: hypothetical protein KO206_01150, partial [Methanomicrobiaceae archaeon]|nr:hypothetical protein [Methanomicrobiaceae archaeon]
AVLTMLLLVLTLMIPGIPVSEEILGFMTLGVLVPFIFFTYFYDTAAVFEDRKVFDSIRRSVEFVLNNAGGVILFYIANILILLGVVFAGVIVWTLLLAEKLEPLIGMTTAEIQELMPQDILSLIGADGIVITAAIYALVALVSTTILYTYKACFYRRLSAGTAALENGGMIGGEYDEKGRWYKY